MEEAQIIILTNDEGIEEEYEILATFNVNEQDYIIIAPYPETEENSEEAFVFRYKEDGDEIVLDGINSEELSIVQKVYDALCEEEE